MQILHSIRIVFDVAIAALFCYIAVTVYLQYRKQVGTTWERLLGAAKDSATILWSKFCILLACVVGQLDSLADLFGAPELKDFINTWIGNPKVISGVMLAIASITIYARMRPGSSNPVK